MKSLEPQRSDNGGSSSNNINKRSDNGGPSSSNINKRSDILCCGNAVLGHSARTIQRRAPTVQRRASVV
ncbi:hypothetical protein AMTR_s00066p00075050 [Amborella trichopoda]|uniref:Uncharacterized protein n=1 Tax=Amborella trichopoda TaxID=13333 RepID=U5DFB2_AMBTC|nr:hypothetical protein AMTR_s00066p00075050 [Amborella trichopoda]